MNVALKKYNIGIQREEVKEEEKNRLAIEISKHLVFLDFFFKDSRLPFILTAAALKEKKNPPTPQISVYL